MERIQSVGVIGTGTMGTGIAALAARRGLSVTIVGRKRSLSKARTAFELAITKKLNDKKLSSEEAALMRAIGWTHKYKAVAAYDLVIESIVEEMEAKRTCLKALGKIMKPECILATNTSSLDLDELAEASGRLPRFLGLHFFSPVEHMKLVEIVVTEATSGTTTESACAFVQALGKHGVVLNGYVVNRLLFPMLIEAVRAVVCHRVSDIESCDRCMTDGLNHPMGPFRLMDAIGIDVVRAISEELCHSLKESFYAPPPILDYMIDEGWLGIKCESRKGFYDYNADPKNPKPNQGLLHLLDLAQRHDTKS